MAPASLTTHYWDLISMRSANGQIRSQAQAAPQKTPRLTFADGRIVVSGICNTMSGSYHIDGNRLQVSRLMSTMIGCMEPGVAELERLIASQLPTLQSFTLREDANRPELMLSFADGSQWILMGTATPETKYGNSGERIFLEVAPERVACSHAVMANHRCLRVREIRYNDGGLKTHVGEWQNFYEEIEGFTHQPGIRNILRIQRYMRQQVPADASRYVYILDMVVESGQAR